MLNTINRTLAFKSLLLDKRDVKKLPESIQKELTHGNTVSRKSLSKDIYSKVKVTDGDEKYCISPDGYATKIKQGTLILDAKNYRFAIHGSKIVGNPKYDTEERLERDFYKNYDVRLEFSKDENIVKAKEIMKS